MDELISKKAVIEAIEKARENVGHNLERSIGKSIIEILDDVGRDVNRLPPALSTNLADVGKDVPDINIGESISRQAAIDALENDKEALDQIIRLTSADDAQLEHYVAQHNQVVYDIDVIKQLPPIQPKRGKWVKDKGQQTLMQNFIERGEVWRVCSVCGAGHMIGHQYAIDKAYHDRHHNYCPNCGAKMEETNE